MSGGDRIELELRFFATFRAAVGQKAFDADATVGDVLAALESELPEMAGDVLDETGEIHPQLSVLRNGRRVAYIDGTATTLTDGDRLSVFPPVAGG